MKKFLSLLLALTLVLSLVVVPARAAEGDLSWGTEPAMTITKGSNPGSPITSGSTVVKGTSLTFSVSAPVVKKDTADSSVDATSGTDYDITYSWTGSTESVSTAGGSSTSATITPNTAGTIIAKCTVTVTPKSSGGTSSSRAAATLTKVLEATITVTDPEATFKDAVKNNITYNGRPCTFGDEKITYYKLSGNETATTPQWAASATGYTGVTADLSGKTLTVKGTPTGGSEITTNFTVQEANASFTANASIAEVISEGQVTLSASALKGFNNATYTWYYGDSSSQTTACSMSGNIWTVPRVTTATDYTVKGVATVNGVEAATATTTVKVIPNTFTIKVTASQPSVSSTTTPVTATATMYNGTTAITDSTELAKITNWRLTKTDTAGAFTTNYTTGNTMTLYAVKSGTAYITATATYKGKTITTALNAGATVTSSLLSYTLPAIQSGSYGTYSNSELLNYANAIVGRPLRGFQSISAFTQNDKNNLGTLTATSSGVYAQYTFSNVSAPRKVGLAQFAATAYSDSTAYTIYFNVPVEPTGTTYPDQYPEPVASYGNTYRYYVQVPSGYYSYYVVGTPNQATRPTDWSQGSSSVYYATTTATTNLYPLTDANFVSGKCTLWIVTADSSGRLSCGQLTVYQKNHDIKYNGVVGNTVQFKHNDFTTFMNEMYGTNTTSYLTFNSVKFTSVPNATSQGTLYYNGVAMTTGYGSNYFNTSTAVTNLDNVSFSVSSRVPSTTKEIRIPFTLYATRYNSYGTSAGTSVTYSGVVVISLVREDVTFTVAPGDSVRFTDSAFLTYLRSASGINYNYNIDYVTFDQSAVNALNEGVLYAYSTGFNAVKTTDRFYYTTTSYNQNALSDVTFRASTYAKTGTTVYIPFTITAKYGTSSATRQVTGTVAIKIAQTMNFVDVKPTDYFYDSVKWAVNNNITKGTSATTFSPNNTCTRAEIVTFLWRAAGSPTPTITRNPFTDVKYPVGSDFYNAILWASQNGIAAGTSTTTFAPNDNCTRAQIVTFLWRYAKKPLGYYTNPFNDVNKTEYAAYYDAILWAAGKGIATGNTPKTFNPDGTCTRAEAVTFLYRYESTK